MFDELAETIDAMFGEFVSVGYERKHAKVETMNIGATW